MKNIRPLKTVEDYEWALCEIEQYFDNLPEEDSAEATRFDILTELVQSFEARQWPVEDIDPVDFLQGYMENKGYSRADLAKVLGSNSRASEIILRRRPLTLPMIQRLVDEWGISADFLIRPYALQPSKLATA